MALHALLKKLCDGKVYDNTVNISTATEWWAHGVAIDGHSHGMLKSGTIAKLRYYQKVNIDYKGYLNAMKTAIYATLYHSISTLEKMNTRNVQLVQTVGIFFRGLYRRIFVKNMLVYF